MQHNILDRSCKHQLSRPNGICRRNFMRSTLWSIACLSATENYCIKLAFDVVCRVFVDGFCAMSML